MLVALGSSIVFIICSALVGGCSAAVLRIRGAAPFLAAAGICAAAALIAATTVLSLFTDWTREAMLAVLLVAAAAAVAGWLLTGRPRPPDLPTLAGFGGCLDAQC